MWLPTLPAFCAGGWATAKVVTNFPRRDPPFEPLCFLALKCHDIIVYTLP